MKEHLKKRKEKQNSIARNNLKIVLFILVAIMIFLVSCKPGDKNYAVSDEQYLVGYILRNVDENTPSVIDFRDDPGLATFNFSFDYPAQNPEDYANVLFYLAPSSMFDSAYLNRIAVPNNRRYYALGKNNVRQTYGIGWQLENYNYINYLKYSDIELGADADKQWVQILLDGSADET